MTYTAAKAQCESDGAFLALPRSDAENDYIRSLIPGSRIWIGINDIDQEGVFVSVDGRDITYTKWLSGQPDSYQNNEDGVHILENEVHNYWNGYWNDLAVGHSYSFVCSYSLQSKSPLRTNIKLISCSYLCVI